MTESGAEMLGLDPPAPPVSPDLDASIEALAKTIVDTVQTDGTPFADRIDAFKAVSAWRLGLAKLKGKKTPDDEDDGEVVDFRTMRRAIAGAGKGE